MSARKATPTVLYWRGMFALMGGLYWPLLELSYIEFPRSISFGDRCIVSLIGAFAWAYSITLAIHGLRDVWRSARGEP